MTQEEEKRLLEKEMTKVVALRDQINNSIEAAQNLLNQQP